MLPAQIENVWLFLIVGSVSAMVFSLAKTGFGGGLGLLAVPIMIYACQGNSDLALGIMLPMLIAADYVAVISWWRVWKLRIIAALLPGVVVGIALAWGALWWLGSLEASQAGGVSEKQLSDAVLKIAVGLIALFFVTLRIVRYLRKKDLVFRPVPWQSVAAGSSAGFTSTLAHAAGPIATMYLLPQPLSKQQFVATSAALFWFVNQLKLPAYWHLGMINTDTLWAGAALLPAIVIGAVLGRFLHARLGRKQFAAVIYTLLAIAGVDLVRKGLMQLLNV
jgi:hypothetical protein